MESQEHRTPLALPQREVWLDQRAWPDSTHLNIGGWGMLEGVLDVACYREALSQLVAQTDALRLVPLPDGTQRVLASATPRLEVVDVSGAAQPMAAMHGLWAQALREPYAQDGTPPWRFILVRVGPALHGISIQFHHQIMDGWGTTQIGARWAAIYNGTPVPAAPPYAAFIERSLAYQASAEYVADGEFWRAQFTEPPAPLIVPRAAALAGLPAARVVSMPVPRGAHTRIEQFAKAHGGTAFSVWLTALALYFSRTRNRREVVIGIPTLNREGKRFLNTPGMCVGLFALPLEIDSTATVSALLARVDARLRAALAHARYPLSAVSQSVARGRGAAMFDVVLSFERQPYDVQFGAARLTGSRQLFSGVARYPLGVTVCEFHPSEDLALVIEASQACFDAEEPALLARRLLHTALDLSVQSAVSAVTLMPPPERAALMGARASWVEDFARWAALRPEAPALISDEGQVDYGTLHARASALAASLPAGLVAMALPRGTEMVLAMLAINLAGGAFLPLDLDAPDARIADILAQSGALRLLVLAQDVARFSPLQVEVQAVDTSAVSAPPAARPGKMAYVLFTSGTTGRPKGVCVSHEALTRRLHWLAQAFEVGTQDRFLQTTQISFDPALIEICLPLSCGAAVVLPPPGRHAPQSWPAWARRHRVTMMALVPSSLQLFVSSLAAPLPLRAACCGGEVLAPEWAQRFVALTGARLFNVYGPTEAVILATAWRFEPGAARLPLGRPVADTRLYVLDATRAPQPMGEVGEVFIGGAALAMHYLGEPALTRAAFIDNPFCPGERLYRTGDLGWLDVDGMLHFAGRIDRQIKLRGYRIELGEIEAVLAQASGVHAAAARLMFEAGHAMICAWAAGPRLDVAQLYAHLRARLPDYMLPARITLLDTLPLKPSGKVDYQALTLPPINTPPPRPPQTAMERALCALWAEALHLPEAGLDADFFAHGGDSLAAIALLLRIESRFGMHAPLSLLLQNPTPAAFARVMGHAGEERCMQVLREGAGAGATLFLCASGEGDVMRYQALAHAWSGEGRVVMLQPTGPESIARIAARYVEAIGARERVMLAGFSVGGVAALEAARMLAARGRAVEGLILIDTIYPAVWLRARALWRMLGWVLKVPGVARLSVNGRRLAAMFADPALTAQVAALRGYQPAVYAQPVTLIESQGLAPWRRWLYRPWARVLPALREVSAPGLHGGMFGAAHVGALAEAMRP